MDASDDQIALQVFRFLGDLYEITADFCRRLRDELAAAGKATRAPTSDIVCRKYKTGVVVHLWVEAMLRGEDSLAWEMDIRKNNEGWLLDASVSRVTQGDGGTATVLQLTHEVLPTFAAAEREVPMVLKELYEVGTEILKEELKP